LRTLVAGSRAESGRVMHVTLHVGDQERQGANGNALTGRPPTGGCRQTPDQGKRHAPV